jgi:hypothetical protein
MADRFPVRYEIGGKIATAILDALLEHLLAVQMTREYGGCDDEASLRKEAEQISGNSSLKVCNSELAPYMTDELDLFLVEHRLAFVKRTDARHEYGGQIEWWRPGMKHLGKWEFTNTEATEVHVSLEFLKKALGQRKTLRKVVEGLEGVAPDPGPLILVPQASQKASGRRRACAVNRRTRESDAQQQTMV